MTNLGPVSLSVPLALGALMALLSAASVYWPRQTVISRVLLAAACLLGLMDLVPQSLLSGNWPVNSLAVAVSTCGAAAGLWSLVLYAQADRGHTWIGLLVGLTLGVHPLLLHFVPSLMPAISPWLAVGEVSYVLASGALVAVTVHGNALGGNFERGRVSSALALGLLFQTVALVAHGAAAQLAWGAYWSWDPVGCWRLVGWLVTAIAAVGTWEMDWSGWRASLALWLTTFAVFAILLGSLALVQWLGLPTLY